jgi:hypothetical protein
LLIGTCTLLRGLDVGADGRFKADNVGMDWLMRGATEEAGVLMIVPIVVEATAKSVVVWG